MTLTHASPSPRQLLVVDDDRLVLAMVANGLTEAGYEVTTAESAEDAETWLASGKRPDLAILDVRMPGQGGLQLAQRLRDLDHIPFMMLSAYNDPDMVEQATLCGALGYAIKPMNIAQLVPAIETALARANEIHDLRVTRHNLQSALDSERDISIAIGITMVQHRLKRNDAFEMLRKTARNRRCKLAALALEIIQPFSAL
jgi:AmiR/NasT family two-component response regulator